MYNIHTGFAGGGGGAYYDNSDTKGGGGINDEYADMKVDDESSCDESEYPHLPPKTQRRKFSHDSSMGELLLKKKCTITFFSPDGSPLQGSK